MDKRLETNEEDQATPAHQDGRNGHAGLTEEQRDGGSTQASDPQQLDHHGAVTRANPLGSTAPYQSGDLRRSLGSVVHTASAKLRDTLRRYPVQVGLGTLGILLVGSVLSRRKRS